MEKVSLLSSSKPLYGSTECAGIWTPKTYGIQSGILEFWLETFYKVTVSRNCSSAVKSIQSARHETRYECSPNQLTVTESFGILIFDGRRNIKQLSIRSFKCITDIICNIWRVTQKWRIYIDICKMCYFCCGWFQFLKKLEKNSHGNHIQMCVRIFDEWLFLFSLPWLLRQLLTSCSVLHQGRPGCFVTLLFQTFMLRVLKLYWQTLLHTLLPFQVAFCLILLTHVFSSPCYDYI